MSETAVWPLEAEEIDLHSPEVLAELIEAPIWVKTGRVEVRQVKDEDGELIHTSLARGRQGAFEETEQRAGHGQWVARRLVGGKPIGEEWVVGSTRKLNRLYHIPDGQPATTKERIGNHIVRAIPNPDYPRPIRAETSWGEENGEPKSMIAATVYPNYPRAIADCYIIGDEEFHADYVLYKDKFGYQFGANLAERILSKFEHRMDSLVHLGGLALARLGIHDEYRE